MKTALLKILIVAMVAAMVTLSVVGSFVVASQSEFSIIAPRPQPPVRALPSQKPFRPNGPPFLPKYRSPDQNTDQNR